MRRYAAISHGSQDPAYEFNSDGTMFIMFEWPYTNTYEPVLNMFKYNTDGTLTVYRLHTTDIEPTTLSGSTLLDYGGLAWSTDDNVFSITLRQNNDSSTAIPHIWEYDAAQDHWIYKSGIIRPTGASATSFGSTIAFNTDGTTLMVGDKDANGGDGQIWEYTRSGNDWIDSTKTIIPSDTGPGNLKFAWNIKLTPDGQNLFASAPNRTVSATANTGSVYHFTNSGGTWTESYIISPTVPIANSILSNISIMPDASRMVVSSNTDNNPTFDTYIFDFSGAVWNETAIVKHTRSYGGSNTGTNVLRNNISADGKTILIQAIYNEIAIYRDTNGYTANILAYTPLSHFVGWLQSDGLNTLTHEQQWNTYDLIYSPIDTPTDKQWTEIDTLEWFNADALWHTTATVNETTLDITFTSSFAPTSLVSGAAKENQNDNSFYDTQFYTNVIQVGVDFMCYVGGNYQQGITGDYILIDRRNNNE